MPPAAGTVNSAARPGGRDVGDDPVEDVAGLDPLLARRPAMRPETGKRSVSGVAKGSSRGTNPARRLAGDDLVPEPAIGDEHAGPLGRHLRLVPHFRVKRVTGRALAGTGGGSTSRNASVFRTPSWHTARLCRGAGWPPPDSLPTTRMPRSCARPDAVGLSGGRRSSTLSGAL